MLVTFSHAGCQVLCFKTFAPGHAGKHSHISLHRARPCWKTRPHLTTPCQAMLENATASHYTVPGHAGKRNHISLQTSQKMACDICTPRLSSSVIKNVRAKTQTSKGSDQGKGGHPTSVQNCFSRFAQPGCRILGLKTSQKLLVTFAHQGRTL